MMRVTDKGDQHGTEIGLFGVPFDPLPSREALAIKHRYMQALALGNVAYRNTLDPYDFFLESLPKPFSEKCRYLGKVSTPTWLQPRPQPADAAKLTLDALNDFIKSGGCLTIANRVHDFIKKNVFPRVPGMIGIDHSSTYGAILSLAEYEEEDLGLIVLDSHFDAVPMKLRHGLIEYAKETESPNIPHDLLSQDDLRSLSPEEIAEWTHVNAENFLLHLLDKNLINPKNLIVVGLADHPGEVFKGIDDPRVKDYLDYFNSLEKAGANLISKARLDEFGTEPLEKALRNLSSRRVYISLDIDIGSLSSVYACRFLDTIGLSFNRIQDIFQTFLDFFPGHLTLAGFDLMEIDIHKMGARLDNTRVDQTERIGNLFLDLIEKIV